MKPKPNVKPANVVGLRVRTFRMAAGLTQKELAARCEERGLKLTRGTLAKVECQVRFVTADELFIIAKVLKMPIARCFPPGFGNGATSGSRKATR